MPKPGTVPTFDTTATNLVAPAALILSAGWADNEIPTARNHNWLFYWIGQWLAWLNAGDLGSATFEDVTITDDLTVGDDVQIGGSVSGAAGTAPVDFPVSAKGPRFYHTTAQRLVISAQKIINPTTENDNLPTHLRSGGIWLLAGNQALEVPIELPVGAHITGWEWPINKVSSGANTISGRLYRQHEDCSAEGALATGNTNSLNAPGATLLTESVDIEIEEQYSYFLRLTPSAGGVGDKGAHVIISWTLPPP